MKQIIDIVDSEDIVPSKRIQIESLPGYLATLPGVEFVYSRRAGGKRRDIKRFTLEGNFNPELILSQLQFFAIDVNNSRISPTTKYRFIGA